MILFIVSWFVSGVLGYGLIYSYFNNEFPNINTYRYEFIWTILTGYSTLIATLWFLIHNLGIRNMFKYGIKL